MRGAPLKVTGTLIPVQLHVQGLEFAAWYTYVAPLVVLVAIEAADIGKSSILAHAHFVARYDTETLSLELLLYSGGFAASLALLDESILSPHLFGVGLSRLR